ncbi:MAG: hypothetical protein COB17_10860 [Sulfurimonas sp.]|nr:MAG: hypothetical protein COB17_10860 [Sulfurimonas sp.]
MSDISFYKFEGGVKTRLTLSPIYVFGNIWAFKHINSSNVRSYEMRTFIQATDGLVSLGNDIIISRDTK